MSTKTTFKRVALVAVASLGFGVLSSVAPASAAEISATTLSVGAATPARVGVFTNATVTARFATALASSDSMTVAARVLTAPSGSGYIKSTASSQVTSNASSAILGWAASASNYTETEAAISVSPVAVAGVDYVAASSDFSATSAGIAAAAKTMGATISFKPDVAGTYTLLLSSGNSSYAAGNASIVWTVTTVGAPASVVLSSVNKTTEIDQTIGSLIKVVLLDAAGNVTLPGDGESLSLASSDADITFTSDGSAAITALDSTNGFTTLGFGYFYTATDAAVTTAQTAVITVAGSGILSAGVNSNITITAKVKTAVAVVYLGDGVANATTAATTPVGYEFTDDETFNSSPSNTSHTFQMTSTGAAAAAKYYPVEITDTSGKITGISGATVSSVLTTPASATATFASLAISATLADTKEFEITDATRTIVITGATAVQDSVEIDQPNLRSAVGGTISLTATTYDQFGLEMPYVGVTFSVSGRNTVAGSLKVSDADGRVAFSYVDAGTAATSNVTDTVTAAPAAGTDATMTATFGTVTVGTVTVTGGATADTVAYPATGATTAAISTAKAGAAGATTTFTATVKDAGANLLGGVLVTWTVDKATAGISKSATVDSASCYTSSDGTCTTTVFAWEAPSKVTVTATAGGKTGTGYQNFVNAAGDARVLSATVSGAMAIAKVVDRYGNVVAGVTVKAKTSNGYFGSGATSTTGETTSDGTVGFALTGAGTITLSLDSSVYTQSDDLLGYVGASAVTAAVAGTTTGVGASLAPAGVNSVAVEVTEGTNAASQAAADAAAEATDAANAATDAANAAAEAADAATAAAQDAADAVAALSAQVAALISGLKAQLTALTNLVIKIQKKVKA